MNESNQKVKAHILATADLQEIALRSMATTFSREAAAREMLEILQKNRDTPKTPSGERYTMIAIRAAMHHLDREIFAKTGHAAPKAFGGSTLSFSNEAPATQDAAGYAALNFTPVGTVKDIKP